MKHIDLEAMEELPAFEKCRRPAKQKRDDHSKPRDVKPWQSRTRREENAEAA